MPAPGCISFVYNRGNPRLTTKQYHLRNWRGSRVGEKFTVNAPPDRQAITEGWQGKQRCQPVGDDAGCSWSLQIPIRLAPSIFKDDIGQRDTADRPKPTLGVADRQQGIGMDIRRKSKCRLRFFLELQVQRRQSRSEAERSCREQHVLSGWVNGRARR